MSVQVRTLGPLGVERDGEELRGAPMGGARERRLLSILAVARGHVVSRDALMERLWEQPPRDPHAGVDTAISRLRRALGPAGTTAESCRPGHRLSCSTDLAHLDQLHVRRKFDEASELKAAVFLDGGPPTEWIDEQRRELARRRVDLLAGGGRAAAERGEHLVALERWREAVTLERLREDARRRVLDGLSRLGRGAEALASFEHCRRVLRKDLDIDPAPETTVVYGTIPAGDHHSHPRLSNGVRAGGQDPPFVNRGREVAWLRAGTEDCAVRVVLGEPGIGKSRLVQEATTDHDGRSVRMATCSRLMAPVPYAVLADLASESLADLAAGGSLSPQSSIARVSRHWRLKLAEGPSLCIIDDLQWADEASLIVLGLVLRDRPPGATVILTARPAELDPDGTTAQFLDLVADLRMTETARLGPLVLEAGDVDASLVAAAKVGQMAEQYGAPKPQVQARMLTAQALLRRPGESGQAAARMRQAAHLAGTVEAGGDGGSGTPARRPAFPQRLPRPPRRPVASSDDRLGYRDDCCPTRRPSVPRWSVDPHCPMSQRDV